MRRRYMLGGLTGGLAASLTAGCGAPPRLASLPERLKGSASFHGLPPDLRIVLDGSEDDLMGRISLDALRREIGAHGGAGALGEAAYLAISGGGENGAWGAGVLTAWSGMGTRPEFKAVTGVSTGALTAPFAFLGPAYDADLERFYTRIGKDDVMVPRGLMSALFGESFYDSAPLFRIVRAVLTPDFVAAIGREYIDKGRLLCVATTNLDVPVGVLWNIGAIAASGAPGAAELIARILLASASIPGAFPPVMIDVEAGGEHFQEMHVDGGTVAQVVFYPPSLSVDDVFDVRRAEDRRLLQAVAKRPRRLYVIRNSRPGADVATVDRSTLKIAGRAVSTLISTQGVGDLYQLYLIAQRDSIDFNVSWIPPSFAEKLPDAFDSNYMNKLYQAGRAAMRNGTVWSKYPPGYSPTPFLRQRPPAAR